LVHHPEIMIPARDELHARSLKEPQRFWAEAAENVHWYKKWHTVLDDSRKPFYRWFAGGEVNTCYNAVDRHVENGRADQVALIYDSPVTGTIKRYTFRELQSEAARCAGALAALGVSKGDRVIIYMPASPRTNLRRAWTMPRRSW
jgi:propionyl-CoA synthetase